MIYVDEVRSYPQKGLWCHMWSDTSEDELHSFAAMIGLRRNWVHRSKGISGEFVHYDLRPSKREQALNNGAQFKRLQEWILERKAHAAHAQPPG